MLAASDLDWSEIDPSILGTLFERGLDPDKRAQLGAHYTDRDKIMLLVEPVVIRPLLAEWNAEKTEIAAELERAEATRSRPARTKRLNEAERRYRVFLNRLRGFTVLDPACGSGNFLYLAPQALKDLEHRVQLEAEAMGFQRAFPESGPANVKGIEINPYAAELARVSVWIGEIQWMRRNGFGEARDPILKPLDTIECRDAILTPDSTEPEWPVADAVIGNPPFLGGKLLITHLGEDYVSRMFSTYAGRVPAEADLVCYWFEKAGRHIASGQAARAGLVATNSIRGGANRRALQAAVNGRRIFEAWSDEPWVIYGAAVRVSLICFSHADAESVCEVRLNGQLVDEIYTDLTPRRGDAGVDLTAVRGLPENAGVAFMGDTKGGPFEIAGDQAREWLRLPANPNGRTNADVLKPWVNGMDLTRRPAGKWVVDFGWTMSEGDVALYEEPYRWLKDRVYPMRQRNRLEAHRLKWWRHLRPRPEMWGALDGLSRYSATPCVAKHRVFAWCDGRICPDHALIVIARDDDATFRYPAQQVSRALVAPALYVAREGQRPALHADHDLRDVPVPGRPDAERAGLELCGRTASHRHCRGRQAAHRAARPVAQPAGMGRVGGRAGTRISTASGSPRRGRRQGAQEAHADEPLQRPPAVALRRARGAGCCRCGGVRLVSRHYR